jgi:hypothetical protein
MLKTSGEVSDVNCNDDLTKLTVAQLKAFLKARGVRQTGKKAELLQLAQLYFTTPTVATLPTGQNNLDLFKDEVCVPTGEFQCCSLSHCCRHL